MGARTLMAAMPTMTAVPPGRMASRICSLVADLVAGGVDRVGGAEVARERELGVEEVARDDLAGAGEARALDDVEPDAAAADHDDGGAGLDLCAAGHGADARWHAASHQGRLGPRHLLADGNQHLGGTDDVLGERPDPRHLEDVFAVAAQAAGAVEHGPADRLMAVTQDRAADGAVETVPALRPEREDDVIARADVAHPRAHLLDDAGRFVAEHHGQGQGP